MRVQREDEGGYAFFRAVGEFHEDERQAQADVDAANRGRMPPTWQPSFLRCGSTGSHPLVTMSDKVTGPAGCLICTLIAERNALRTRIEDAARLLVEGKAVQAHQALGVPIPKGDG